jgi:aminoglycoside phosphotransferase (APT) family kinase protein
MHPDEVRIDVATATRLIAEQFPEMRDEPVREVRTAATVHAIFRVGAEFAARFPLRSQDPGELETELRAEADAALEFASVAHVPAPRPVGLGRPGHGYPMPWSVQTWLPGRDATVDDPGDSTAFAEDLGALITRLRGADTRGRRFTGSGRGGHLPDHDEWVDLCFRNSEGLFEVEPLRAMWAELRVLPAVDDDVMSHGDLTPPNLLVEAGRLAGVLDNGGYAAADPALDLVSAWHLLGAGPREVVRESLGCGEIQWRRGMAWALQQAMGAAWYYVETNPVMSRWAQRTLDRLVRAGG